MEHTADEIRKKAAKRAFAREEMRVAEQEESRMVRAETEKRVKGAWLATWRNMHEQTITSVQARLGPCTPLWTQYRSSPDTPVHPTLDTISQYFC